MKLLFPLAVLAIILYSSCTSSSGSNADLSHFDYYTQNDGNRMAAEWEPASGVMITWPLCLPYKLAVELAADSHLYTLVNDEKNKQEAIRWYLRWGIDTSRVTFVIAHQGIDAWWVRDWGPPAVFNKEKRMSLADGKYIYSTPVSGFASNDRLNFIYKTAEDKIIRTETDDKATKEIGEALNINVLPLSFISTGGNVMTDGLGTAFSTSILTNENRFDGLTDEQFLSLNKELLGLQQYHILPNFEDRGIQHIDCYMKLLNEETILVARPPADHESYPIYESIIDNELSRLKTIYNRPFKILRIDTYPYSRLINRLAAYTNSLILNKTVYVPLFGIPGDSIALKQWAEVMPGYSIKGFEFDLAKEPKLGDRMKSHYSVIGWNSDDALHCRTRAIWDANMLYISVKKIETVNSSEKPVRVFASIIDYSKKGLQSSPVFYWRTKGENAWHQAMFNATNDSTHFFTDIPALKDKTGIEYYISASSLSGHVETMPRTAPFGFYSFN